LLLGVALYVGYLETGAGVGPGEEPARGPSTGDVVEPGQMVSEGTDETRPQFELTLVIDPVADLQPPPPRRPDLRLWRGTTLVAAEATWVAGTAALPEARVIQGRQLVRFHVPGGRDIFRVVLVGRTGQDIDVRWLGSVDYQGQVFGADKSPLAGARVWLAGERAETDANGRFRIPDLPRGSGLPLVIRAPGHAGYFRVLDLIRPDRGRDVSRNTFGLTRGVDLKVRFVAPVDDFTKGAVFVQPVSKHKDTRVLHHPFLMQAVEGGVPLESDGIATVRGLPVDTKVRVFVWHPDTGIRHQPVVHLFQRKGKQPQASIRASKAEFLVGKVRTDNQGVPGAWLVSRGSSIGLPSVYAIDLLPPFLYLGTGGRIGYAITAADGSYRLPLRSLDYVRVTAPGRHGLALQIRVPKVCNLILPRPVAKDEPRIRVRFANARGRTFRLRVLSGPKPMQQPIVLSGPKPVQQPFLLKDTDDYAQPLGNMVLADIHVAVRERDGNIRRWDFPNRVVQGLLELPLDY